MVTLARCCTSTAAIATTSSTIPYKRLNRSKQQEEQQQEQQQQKRAKQEQQEQKRAKQEQQQQQPKCPRTNDDDMNPEDTVVLKLAIVGDCESGKSCLMTKYIGSEQCNMSQECGIVLKEKSMKLRNANIVFSMWELAGSGEFGELLPRVCEGAAALLIMFDLTRRSTLNSVKQWFVKARECNKFAIPVLVGTKYDEFIRFPDDIQLALTQQAILYARTMGASLFFSSSTHNINVHKIFKVIVAKLFDLHCSISRNHKLGEPILLY